MVIPRLSIVTCCKGRLKYLKQALPTFVVQPESEVVVVDYDCPEGTKEWVAASFPEVRFVSVSQEPVFNASRARNIGAKHARASWLVFCDADDLLSASFSLDLLRLAEPGTYQRGLRRNKAAPMPLACKATTFSALAGYDDAMQGWGMEDVEFMFRLGRSGVREVGRWFTDEQRYSTYGSVQEAVIASLADAERDTVFEIPVVGSLPPWAARRTASDIRSFFKVQSERMRERPPPA